jgi:predicted phosphoribosyltransferase
MPGRPYHDRREAGRYLAERLANYAGWPDVLVLALPRGGVPVAFEVARALGATIGVFLVRKLGVPGHEELAFGAIDTGGVRLLNFDVVRGRRRFDDSAGWAEPSAADRWHGPSDRFRREERFVPG